MKAWIIESERIEYLIVVKFTNENHYNSWNNRWSDYNNNNEWALFEWVRERERERERKRI